ncbi:MAG: two-component regulator propeller domain-containing protein [Chitinophagales bacterium]
MISWSATQAQQYNFAQYSIAEGLPQKKVTFLLEDAQGYIWVATENGGISRFDGKSFENFSTKNGLLSNQVNSIFEEEESKLYVVTSEGVNYFDGKEFKTTDNIPTKLDKTESLDSIFQFLPALPIQSLKVTSIFNHPSGQIWLGSENSGLLIINPKDSSIVKITEREGLPNNSINCIIKDSWDNIWLGTDAGLVRFMGENFTHFDKSNGLHGNKINAIAEDHKGNIWLAASNNGIALFDGHSFTKMTRDQGYLDIKTNVIFESSKKEMWIGTHGGGLLVIDSNQYSIVTIKDGLPSSWVNGIEEDNNGNIWISTPANGMAKIISDENNFLEIKEIGKIDGLPDTYISTIKKDAEGKIWLATNYGKIGYFNEKDSIVVFDEKNGLPGSPIECFTFDDNIIYIGTDGDGIYSGLFTNDSIQFEALKIEESLLSNRIRLLAFDKLGYLWAGCDRGLNKITLVNGLANEVEKYGPNEGFLGIETNQNAVLVDSKNNIWFGTNNGLSRHKPTNNSLESFAPIIHFEDIALFYESLSKTEFSEWVLPNVGLKEGLSLPYNKNHLSFDFKAIHQNYPNSIQYQWQLEGAEEMLSPLTKKTSVNYTNIPRKLHLYRLRAISENGLRSDPISASFIIEKPFWQNVWLQLLVLLIFLLLVALISYLWIRSIRKKEQAKREQLEMKNHLLTLEQKALQLQMNPHFIFNALNSIQSLVVTQDYDKARLEINNFAVLMRSILSNSKKEKISLEEEVNTLQTYLTLEQFCQPTPFDFKIDTHNIDLEETELPPMLVQPFVENAVIHGISHLKDKKGQLAIGFKIDNSLLICSVEDNGIGREKSQLLHQSKKPGHQSVAMEVTIERLEALKEKKNYIAFEIEDLKDKEGNAIGTKVILRLPYESRF